LKNCAGALNICVFDPDYVVPSFYPAHMSRNTSPIYEGEAIICVSIKLMAWATRNIDPLHDATTLRIPGGPLLSASKVSGGSGSRNDARAKRGAQQSGLREIASLSTTRRQEERLQLPRRARIREAEKMAADRSAELCGFSRRLSCHQFALC
jgi:hypothetical protein